MSVIPEMSDTKQNLELDDYECDFTADEHESFSNRYKLVVEKEINNGKFYILHLSATSEVSCNIAIGTSNNTCEVYRFGENQLAKLETFDNEEHPIVGVQFSPESNDLFYSGSILGSIKLWDLRSPQKCVLEFSETTAEQNGDTKPITCFDMSSNNRLLCAGTELYKGEAFILFWDIRNTNILGGYWESHTDDITQVKFNENDVNQLMSGSVDGLINVYDVKHTNEDDALIDSFNTESSVEQLLWYNNQNGNNCINCITHTADIQLWSLDGAEPYVHFRRSDITKAIKRKSEAHCYIAAAHKQATNELLILAGSNWNEGEYLKCVCSSDKELQGFCTLKENKQRVRSSSYNPHHNMLITGGEQGILNVWNVNLNLN